MNITKIAFLAAAALIFAGCGPNRHPDSWRGTPQTGTTDVTSVPEEIDDGNDGLIDEEPEARGESVSDEKVANWISSNSIPESAKLAVIYFEFDKFNVEAGERGKLDAVADAVKAGNVYIVGYSDYFGTEEYNLALSDKRAQAVKNYLMNLGADDSAQVRAMGEAYAVQNGTKSEVAEDRKVIVVDGNAQ